MKKLPNKEQYDALVEYAKRHGKDWKADLNADWCNGQNNPYLQQVRNNFGPNWLVKFQLRTWRLEQIQIVADHYIIAAIWADAPEGTTPKPTAATKKEAFRQCEKFVADCGTLFDQAMDCTEEGYGAHPDCGGRPEAAFGHDFWLTRQGHGVGFWDRKELPEELREKLSHMAHQAKEASYDFYKGWFNLYPSMP